MMFTITVQDEKLYRQLMERVEQSGESVEDLLREWLGQGQEVEPTNSIDDETPATRLLRLIDAADLPFINAFDARDAGEILRRETGEVNWRIEKGNDGSR